MYLDSHELINHDGSHSITEKYAPVAHRKGKHKIVLKYFQLMGGQGLKISWIGPGFEKTEILASVFFHEKEK